MPETINDIIKGIYFFIFFTGILFIALAYTEKKVQTNIIPPLLKSVKKAESKG